MNEGKQIGEMKRIASKCMTSWLNNETPKAFPDYIAEALYTAGFYKQSEGEWISELQYRCDWRGKKQQYYQPNSCSVCHEAVVERTPFCPNCGAKMKGENK